MAGKVRFALSAGRPGQRPVHLEPHQPAAAAARRGAAPEGVIHVERRADFGGARSIERLRLRNFGGARRSRSAGARASRPTSATCSRCAGSAAARGPLLRLRSADYGPAAVSRTRRRRAPSRLASRSAPRRLCRSQGGIHRSGCRHAAWKSIYIEIGVELVASALFRSLPRRLRPGALRHAQQAGGAAPPCARPGACSTNGSKNPAPTLRC